MSDVLSVSAMVLAADLGSSELGLLGIASFIATPPIIHIAHGQWLAAGLSLTLRAGGTTLLVAGLALGLSDLGDDQASDDDDGAATALSILGIMALFAAPLVDAVIANEKKEQAPASAWTVQPWLSPRTGAGGLTFSARL